MAQYYLLLGSNLGNRKQNLDNVLHKIKEKLGNILEKSSVYVTEAWGLEDQPDFLNMALIVESQKNPEQFLQITKVIEKECGRVPTKKWSPREMDIDILYIDNQIIQSENFTVPHPGIYHRNFVLIPMIEIAGEFIDPVKNITMDEIYDECTDTKEVFLYDEE
ncbi:MAG: 2-amino-4-hydroxy-6-hydroxymethyldihydropteridine diphosphokinase [Saprospiraceae bacterium]|nr:2-amino-4-hydroxy-6-hydroxymethyldihydropteridine diphosphokinase [Saprospiraceae bacterium]MBK8081785.1 2-amino-4-hydroxy-6-hydroxymethyldihydropteridine diphosphokinase [Saprospiraceae bacterium]